MSENLVELSVEEIVLGEEVKNTSLEEKEQRKQIPVRDFDALVSFELENIWDGFKKQLTDEVKSLTNTLSSEISKTRKSVNEELCEIKEVLKEIEEYKKIVSEETKVLRESAEIVKSLGEKVTVVNNPSLSTIIEEISKGVAKESDKELKEKLEFGEISEAITNVNSFAKKTEEALFNTTTELSGIISTLKKGNSEIAQSEYLLIKLMSTLRFLEKLDNDSRNKIVSATPEEIETLFERIKTEVAKKENIDDKEISNETNISRKQNKSIDEKLNYITKGINNTYKIVTTIEEKIK